VAAAGDADIPGVRTGDSGRAGDTQGGLGIRHEDTVAVIQENCENLAPKWSGTPEEPAVV
jgi:hypothetical protein